MRVSRSVSHRNFSRIIICGDNADSSAFHSTHQLRAIDTTSRKRVSLFMLPVHPLFHSLSFSYNLNALNGCFVVVGALQPLRGGTVGRDRKRSHTKTEKSQPIPIPLEVMSKPLYFHLSHLLGRSLRATGVKAAVACFCAAFPAFNAVSFSPVCFTVGIFVESSVCVFSRTAAPSEHDQDKSDGRDGKTIFAYETANV